ncbi:MAG TPA: rRNA maturation RNase YbeY, partial [Steroidobacteraceae bacterium]
DIATWAGTAIGRRAGGRELGVRVVGSTESRRLNARYRGKDKPTNVLSFPPASLPGRQGVDLRPLGDLVICAQVVRSEARAQRKPLEAHWAHLVVHGALHLIGYDHEREQEAKRMERREIAVLRRLGFANPYKI